MAHVNALWPSLPRTRLRLAVDAGGWAASRALSSPGMRESNVQDNPPISVNMCMCVCIIIYIYAYVCICVCTYVQILILYFHTRTYTYIRMYTQPA